MTKDYRGSIHFDVDDIPMRLSEGRRCTSANESYGGPYGYVDENNEWVVKPKFDSLNRFVDGLAIVGWSEQSEPYDPMHPMMIHHDGMIDIHGNVVIPLEYTAHSSELREGLAVFESKAGYEYFDKYGHNPFGRAFEKTFDFMWGYAAVKMDGVWCVIDRNGRVVKTLKNQKAMDKRKDHELKGIFCRKLNGKYGMKDWMGNWKIPAVYDEAMYECCGVVQAVFQGNIGFINTNNEVILDFQFDRLYGNDYGYSLAFKGNKVGMVRFVNGELIVPAEYDECTWIADSHFYARKGDEWHRFNELGKEVPVLWWGVIDTSGKWVVYPQYTFMESMQYDTFMVRIGERWGLISKDGTVLLKPDWFDVMTRFDDKGLAFVENKGALIDDPKADGYIDFHGNFYPRGDDRISGHYMEADPSEFESFEEDGLWGFKKPDGSILIEPRFAEVGKFIKGLAPAAIIKN